MTGQKKEKRTIDWGITVIPFAVIVLVAALLLVFPEASGAVIDSLHGFLANDFGFVYLLFGLGILLISLYVAFSKYGNIKLGKLAKPRYSNFTWGSMIFTSTMAADMLFFALHEWAYYFAADPFAAGELTLAERQINASEYPLFHWGPIAWAFYILPAAAYGYMMYVKKTNRQRLSEACRPIFKDKVDGPLGKTIDVFAVVCLLAATATSFTLATPLLSEAICEITGLSSSTLMSVLILVMVAVVFTLAVIFGMKGISKLAQICIIFFFILLGIFFFFGPTRYIVETGVSAIGGMFNDFLEMATWMDPLRLSGDGVTGFPQDWTVFYWAFWISWSVATPFFIGSISEGRTIRQTILGSYISGLSATFLAFIVFGNFGLYQQVTGKVDVAGQIAAGASVPETIMDIFSVLPFPKIAIAILIIAMVAFYASTFDALTMVIASYSLKKISANQEPGKGLRVFWSITFIIFPIALLFSEGTMSMLQTVFICAALPILVIVCIIVAGFLKELRHHKESESTVEKKMESAKK